MYSWSREQLTRVKIRLQGRYWECWGEPLTWVQSVGFRVEGEVRDPGRDQTQDSPTCQVKRKLGHYLAGSEDQIT